MTADQSLELHKAVIIIAKVLNQIEGSEDEDAEGDMEELQSAIDILEGII